MFQVILRFHTSFSQNSVFFSESTYEKHIVSEKYCIARDDDKIRFLPNCSYHIILIGNNKELLQKLDARCFNYQHMDSLFTLFKNQPICQVL